MRFIGAWIGFWITRMGLGIYDFNDGEPLTAEDFQNISRLRKLNAEFAERLGTKE